MRVAPIIHTKTYSCDFDTGFMVRPDLFLYNDIKWARKNVLEATGSIDLLQGERWLIIDNGKYRIAGVVGFLKNICAKCNLSVEDKKKSEELFYDEKRRLVYAFIGVVIDTSNSESYGKISYEYLWKIYLETIYPIWKRTYQEVILKNFEDVDFENSVSKPLIEENFKIGGQEFYESNLVRDYELFEYYLCNKDINNFSFCTNLVDFILVKQCNFSIITTSQNIITRLERNHIVTPSSNTYGQSTVGKIKQTEGAEIVQKTDESKKKSFVVLMSLLITCAMIILILLLMMGN